jgi:hypothetical protein
MVLDNGLDNTKKVYVDHGMVVSIMNHSILLEQQIAVDQIGSRFKLIMW